MICKLFYRGRQLLVNLAIRLLSREPELVTGSGCLLKIPEMLAEKKIRSVLVITTPGFIRRKSLLPLFATFAKAGIKATVFTDVISDPDIDCVTRAFSAYMEGDCEAVIAVGGGSVIDCAKIALAKAVRPDMDIRNMRGMLKIRRKLPPLYAVPTTAGTGSEVTAGAVITDGNLKLVIEDFCLVPSHAILDPALSLSMPKELTAATGIDALTHAVEAYINRFSSKKARRNARLAVKVIYENLPKAFADRNDIGAREKMLTASFCAGIAITNAFVGYAHALAHGIGGLYGIQHGLANAAILPSVLEYYGKSAWKRLSELADLVGAAGESQREKSGAFIQSVRKLSVSLGLPDKIQPLDEKDFELLADRAFFEANPAYPVPEIWSNEYFKKVLSSFLPSSAAVPRR